MSKLGGPNGAGNFAPFLKILWVFQDRRFCEIHDHPTGQDFVSRDQFVRHVVPAGDQPELVEQLVADVSRKRISSTAA